MVHAPDSTGGRAGVCNLVHRSNPPSGSLAETIRERTCLISADVRRGGDAANNRRDARATRSLIADAFEAARQLFRAGPDSWDSAVADRRYSGSRETAWKPVADPPSHCYSESFRERAADGWATVAVLWETAKAEIT